MDILYIQRKVNGKIVSPRKEIAEQTRIRSNLESSFYTQLRKTFINIGDKVADEVEQGQLNPLYLERIEPVIGDLLIAHYRKVMQIFTERSLSLFTNLKRRQRTFEEYVQNYIREVGGMKITAISNTSRNQIMKISLKITKKLKRTFLYTQNQKGNLLTNVHKNNRLSDLGGASPPYSIWLFALTRIPISRLDGGIDHNIT